MTELLTAAQMRAIEHAAIRSGEVTGLELMERAGQCVVEAIFEKWPDLDRRGASPSRSPEYLEKDEEDPLRAVVLCGPGNNGGDGFVVARLLRELGWGVEVFLYGDPKKLPPDARVSYERWGGSTKDVSEIARGRILYPDILIDALFGTGLTRSIEDVRLWEVLWAYNDAETAWELRRQDAGTHIVPPRTVAIDVPSGLCADSGKVVGE
ncbi:NAD(P)H-hydrate epimerase, partial [Ruegeria sp. NA]